MKNLVLKIIRGSYPPVHSRYSYDLRCKSKHLKGNLTSRVSDAFGSQPLCKLSVTFLDRTLVVSCQ